jgi:uncharacterized membrane protein
LFRPCTGWKRRIIDEIERQCGSRDGCFPAGVRHRLPDQSITQDKTTDVSVGVTRKGFTDPVKVSFEGLPSGVKLTTTDMEIPKDKDSAKFTLKADKDAKPGDYEAKATAKSGDMSKSVTFKVTVKEDK